MLSACFTCLLPLGERTPLLAQELQARAGVVVPTRGGWAEAPFWVSASRSRRVVPDWRSGRPVESASPST